MHRQHTPTSPENRIESCRTPRGINELRYARDRLVVKARGANEIIKTAAVAQ